MRTLPQLAMLAAAVLYPAAAAAGALAKCQGPARIACRIDLARQRIQELGN